jgi:hypothetical protein
MGKSKIVKAVYSKLGQTQTYHRVLYNENNTVEGCRDVSGPLVHDDQEELKQKYPGIQIEVQ